MLKLSDSAIPVAGYRPRPSDWRAMVLKNEEKLQWVWRCRSERYSSEISRRNDCCPLTEKNWSLMWRPMGSTYPKIAEELQNNLGSKSTMSHSSGFSTACRLWRYWVIYQDNVNIQIRRNGYSRSLERKWLAWDRRIKNPASRDIQAEQFGLRAILIDEGKYLFRVYWFSADFFNIFHLG